MDEIEKSDYLRTFEAGIEEGARRERERWKPICEQLLAEFNIRETAPGKWEISEPRPETIKRMIAAIREGRNVEHNLDDDGIPTPEWPCRRL